MYVIVTPTRHAGRRVAHPKPAFEGFIQIAPGRRGLIANVTKPMAVSLPPLGTLYGVALLGADNGCIHLLGYEESDGRGVMQEWACEVVDVSAGFDAQGRRL